MKKQIMGKVTEVGWEPSNTGKSLEIYAVVKVKFGRSKNPKNAEKRMKTLKKDLLGKTITLFPQQY